MFGRLTALFLLGIALIKTLLTRLGGGRPLERFSENYGSEGIAGVSRAEAIILGAPSGCTACGRCDRGEGPRIANSRTGYQGMMAFALSGQRSLPDYSATARTIEGVPTEAFEDAQRACPEGVPLVQLSRLVREHAERQAGKLAQAG